MEIRNLRQVNIWHSTAECLPPAEGDYLCVTDVYYDNSPRIAILHYTHNGFNTTANNDKHKMDVLYWASIPNITNIDPFYEKEDF